MSRDPARTFSRTALQIGDRSPLPTDRPDAPTYYRRDGEECSAPRPTLAESLATGAPITWAERDRLELAARWDAAIRALWAVGWRAPESLKLVGRHAIEGAIADVRIHRCTAQLRDDGTPAAREAVRLYSAARDALGLLLAAVAS